MSNILDLYDKNLLTNAREMANKIKVLRSLIPRYDSSETDFEKLEDVIEIYELAIIDLWKYSEDPADGKLEDVQKFNKLCNECFSLLEVLPVPEEHSERIKYVLKLLTYAYLGEKWEDMRRYLKENDDLWITKVDTIRDWDLRLFVNIYHAILYLVKKESWKDVTKSTDLILQLKDEQRILEKGYLENTKQDSMKSSIFQLASLYHLAKSVEIVSRYMLQGEPTDVLDRKIFLAL